MFVHINEEFTEYTPEGRERLEARRLFIQSLSREDQDWLRAHLKKQIQNLLDQVDRTDDPAVLKVFDHHLALCGFDLQSVGFR